MKDRKLDTSRSGPAATERAAFDAHLDGCADCQPHLCHAGEQLWRTTCLAALRADRGTIGTGAQL